MASGTITFSNSDQGPLGTYIQGKIEWWEDDYDEYALTSKVHFDVYVRKCHDTETLNITTDGTWSWYYNINGNTNSGTKYLEVLGWTKVLDNYIKTIQHDTSTGEAYIYLGGSVTSPSDSTAVPSKTSSGGQYITLDTMYVEPSYSASTITRGASSVRMGGSINFTINREDSSLSHRVTYSIGSPEYTGIIYYGDDRTSISWTVPDLLQYTGGSNKTATITCETYHGSDYIGVSYCTVTVKPYAASEISLLQQSVDVGASIVIGVTSYSPSYTNQIKYKLNNGSEVDITTLTGGGSYSWTVPSSIAQSMTGSGDRLYFYCYTKYGSTSIGSDSAYCSVTVSQATVPTLSPTTVAMGSKMTISLPRSASSFTHQVTYSFVDASGLIHSSAGTSLSWTVPYDLAKQIPQNTSATGYIRVVTFNGSTQVGQPQEAQFTATVPDNATTKPTISMVLDKVQPSSIDSRSALYGYWIQGVTKVRATFTASSEYSEIPELSSAFTLTVGGSTTNGNPSTSNEIDASGTVTVTGSVTDKRGYVGSTSQNITVYPYSAPRVIPYTGYSDIVCERCTSAGTPASDGEYLLIKAARTFSPLTISGTTYNECYFDYRYKESSASWQGDDVGWETLSISGSFNGIVPNVALNKAKEYTIQIRAKDKITNKHIITVTIPSEVTPLHLADGGAGIGIGRLCDGTGMHIGWPATFHTGIERNTIFYTESLSSGWNEGHYLTEEFPGADVSKVGEYSIFIAVVTGIANSTTKRYAVLCARQGDEIYGSLDIATSTGIQSISIGMSRVLQGDLYIGLMLDSAKSLMHTASGSHGALTTLSVSNQLFITALYALL